MSIWKAILWVALGGSAGSVFRFLGQKWISTSWGAAFPLGTLIVNCCGCFIIGLFFGWSSRWSGFEPALKLLLMTGFCGGFTTFSAFTLESMGLIQQGKLFYVLLYVSGSVIFGIGFTFLGLWVTRTI